jgi:protein-S-isoprenylcysteine O-methyltransferase Ste14
VVLFVAVASIALLGGPWPVAVRVALRVVGGLLIASGVALAAAGSRHLGAALTPYPRPLADASLRQGGVYGWVRHPIYGGILLTAFGAAAWTSPWTLVPAILLALLFDRKRRREEVWLSEAYEGYAAYRERVPHAFWPGVW